jgi:hypothetical protein
MILFDTRMSGTSTDMVSHRVQLELPVMGAHVCDDFITTE